MSHLQHIPRPAQLYWPVGCSWTFPSVTWPEHLQESAVLLLSDGTSFYPTDWRTARNRNHQILTADCMKLHKLTSIYYIIQNSSRKPNSWSSSWNTAHETKYKLYKEEGLTTKFSMIIYWSKIFNMTINNLRHVGILSRELISSVLQ